MGQCFFWFKRRPSDGTDYEDDWLTSLNARSIQSHSLKNLIRRTNLKVKCCSWHLQLSDPLFDYLPLAKFQSGCTFLEKMGHPLAEIAMEVSVL